MERRFSNIYFACCASWFSKKKFVSKFWPQDRDAELGVSADIFGNCDVPYEEESRVTRSKQCNVWRRTISIRTDLSTGRRTSTTWRRRRKKRFTRTCTYSEYRLVCLKEMYFYDATQVVVEWESIQRTYTSDSFQARLLHCTQCIVLPNTQLIVVVFL